jgi:thiosulfate/3-mercaptopyruvate sulfurtransferase
MMKSLVQSCLGAGLLLATLASGGLASQTPAARAQPAAMPAAVIPAAAIIQPAALMRMLRSAHKPIVLQVGSGIFYAEAHIPGAEYVGAAHTAAGLRALRARAAHLNKREVVVLYCGCCPWHMCPNIRPAYEQLRALGFTRVKTLYLARNFGTNWVAKGYPVAKGR